MEHLSKPSTIGVRDWETKDLLMVLGKLIIQTRQGQKRWSISTPLLDLMCNLMGFVCTCDRKALNTYIWAFATGKKM